MQNVNKIRTHSYRLFLINGVVGYVIAFFVAVILSVFSIWRTDLFSICTIQVPLLIQADPEPKEFFAWPSSFRYLNRGRQMFAFESPDGLYVLKFFNIHQVQTSWYLNITSLWNPKKRASWKEKMRIYPESYRLAYEHMREETGLVLVHMGTSFQTFPTVELIDKASRRFKIDLNTIPFVVQKKGTSTLIRELSFTKDSGLLQRQLDQFLSFHQKRINHYIADYDRDIKRNYSWHGTELIYIDPARFFYEKNLKKPERLCLEWWNATYRLRKWLTLNAASEVDQFDAKVEEYRIGSS